MIDLFKKQSNRRGYAYIWTLRPTTKNKEQVAALVISNLLDTKNLTSSNDTTQISLMLVEFAHKDKHIRKHRLLIINKYYGTCGLTPQTQCSDPQSF